MTEDYDFALNIRLVVVNAVPYRIFFLGIVPVHIVVVRCNCAAMHEDIRLTVDLNVDIQRQAVKIIEYLLTDRLSNVFYIELLLQSQPIDCGVIKLRGGLPQNVGQTSFLNKRGKTS